MYYYSWTPVKTVFATNTHQVFNWSSIFISQARFFDLNKLSHPTSNLYVSMGKSPLIIDGKGIGQNLTALS